MLEYLKKNYTPFIFVFLGITISLTSFTEGLKSINLSYFNLYEYFLVLVISLTLGMYLYGLSILLRSPFFTKRIFPTIFEYLTYIILVVAFVSPILVVGIELFSELINLLSKVTIDIPKYVIDIISSLLASVSLVFSIRVSLLFYTKNTRKYFEKVSLIHLKAAMDYHELSHEYKNSIRQSLKTISSILYGHCFSFNKMSDSVEDRTWAISEIARGMGFISKNSFEEINKIIGLVKTFKDYENNDLVLQSKDALLLAKKILNDLKDI